MLDDVIEVVDATVDEVNVVVNPKVVETILVESNVVDTLYRDLVGMRWIWSIVISINSKKVDE